MKILIRLSYNFLIILTFLSVRGYAQFPPAAGQPGTTAMFMDSTAFIGWVKKCHVTRGFVNIADTSVLYNGLNRASYGTDDDALGKPDNSVISLGDGGYAVLTFENPISNGPGFDFAVFENSLDGSFLELGFVEVSSDGVNFFRLPAISDTQDTLQLGTFGTINPTKINNLAGKYRVLFGTPFDLDTLRGIPGLDVNDITYVKIIDVVGNISTPYASHDSQGNLVNDPWPTPFNTCGFDLDAVGVIHDVIQSVNKEGKQKDIRLYPNPVQNYLNVNFTEPGTVCFILTTVSGSEIKKIEALNNNSTISLSSLPGGIYIANFTFPDGTTETRKIIKL